MKQSVSIFLLYMASQVVAGALSLLWVLLPNLFRGGKPDMGSPSPLVLSISSALLSALLVAGLLAYYRREERCTPHRRAVKALDAAGVGGAVVSLLLLNFAIDFLLRPLHLSDGFIQTNLLPNSFRCGGIVACKHNYLESHGTHFGDGFSTGRLNGVGNRDSTQEA